MSNVKVNTINDASGGSNVVLYGVAAPANSMGFRNRIINGDMRIDQRNAGTSITPSGVAAYSVDRWLGAFTQNSKYSLQQNAGGVAGPTGFSNYIGATTVSAYSALSTDTFYLAQHIEGFNFADMGWGTASASAVTLSFWVRSSLAGAFGGACVNGAQDRSYPFSFTISVANTWEFKTVVIAGDTSGTWTGATNGIGLRLRINLGSGANFSATAGAWGAGEKSAPTGAISVVNTAGATFYVTGVQLEAGTVASPFERRDYGRELMMCQRYARFNTTETGASWATTVLTFSVGYDIEMRSAPTVTIVNGANAMTDLGVATRTATGIPYYAATTRGAQVDISTVSTTNNKVHVLAPSVLFLNSEL